MLFAPRRTSSTKPLAVESTTTERSSEAAAAAGGPIEFTPPREWTPMTRLMALLRECSTNEPSDGGGGVRQPPDVGGPCPGEVRPRRGDQ